MCISTILKGDGEYMSKGLLLSVDKPFNDRFSTVEFDGLDDIYKLLNCRLIDVVVDTIGGIQFDIILDDEGWFKKNPVISMIRKNESSLVGNLIFTHHNQEGEFTEITDEEIQLIKDSALCIVKGNVV